MKKLIPLDSETLRQWALPMPGSDADKEVRGHVLIVAGSREIPGAALLAASAALRAGAGKLTVATPQSVAIGLALALPEARVIALPESDSGGLESAGVDQLLACMDTCGAMLVGPGLMDAETTSRFVRRLLAHSRSLPCVLDALAMDAALSDKAFTQPVLLTPHAGEMAHLTGVSKNVILDDPVKAGRELASRLQAVVVLKGATTILASPEAGTWSHTAAVPGLATSGSGDVLAGIMVGLAARGASLEQAAAWGIVVHAQAGERLARRFGPIGYLARELLDELPALLHQVRPTPQPLVC